MPQKKKETNSLEPKASDHGSPEPNTPNDSDRTKIALVVLSMALFTFLCIIALLAYQNYSYKAELEDLRDYISSLEEEMELYVEEINLEEGQNDDYLVEVDEQLEESQTVEDYGTEETEKNIVIMDRKVVQRVPDPEDISGWKVVKTFPINDMVERLIVNEEESMFVYGVYLNSGSNQADDPVGDRYTYYLYDTQNGKITKLNGLKFVADDGVETEVDFAFRWISEEELLVGNFGREDYWLDHAFTAIYNVNTGELEPISEEEVLERGL